MAGRPRSFDRDAALETALDAFWARGYDGVTIAQLAAEIGIGPPSLYAAFGDKRALFEEAAARYAQRSAAVLAADLGVVDVRVAVERVLASAATGFTGGSTPDGCLVMGEPLLAQRRSDTRQAVLRRLEQGVRDGQLPADALPALADFVDTVLAGMAARARDGAGRTQLQNAADVAMRAWPV